MSIKKAKEHFEKVKLDFLKKQELSAEACCSDCHALWLNTGVIQSRHGFNFGYWEGLNRAAEIVNEHHFELENQGQECMEKILKERNLT